MNTKTDPQVVYQKRVDDITCTIWGEIKDDGLGIFEEHGLTGIKKTAVSAQNEPDALLDTVGEFLYMSEKIAEPVALVETGMLLGDLL